MSDWTIAVLPLIGVILGAALQFWFSRTAEKDKHINELKSEAYSDYLRAVAAAAHLRSDEDLVGALKAAADAKARIVVYGSSSVIKALARFEESGAVLSNDQSAAYFIELISAMRPKKAAAISDNDIRLVLLGTTQQGFHTGRAKSRRAD
jgi:hypothetical protein